MATRQNESSCFSCRARKVKCDRILPQCSPCKKRKLNCEVPVAPPRMLWLRPRMHVGPDEELEDLHARRRPLFAAHDLAHNAADLLCIAGDSSVLSILDELDRKTEDIENDQTLCNGPFHVFQANDMRSPAPTHTLSDLFDAEVWDSTLANVDDMLEGEDEGDTRQLAKAPEYLTLKDTILQSDPFDLDGIDFIYTPDPETLAEPLLSLASSPSQAIALDLVDFSMPVAKMLLDHYRTNMVTFYTPARTEVKSPWEAIYIPSLLSTVGEIGLAGDSSNAKISVLFAVFAISAFCLDGRSASTSASTGGQGSQDWNALGELYRERSTRRLKQSLADLSRKQAKKEKYKDILMALLSMVTISVVSGKMENAAHYLRDVEEIINLHGVQKASRSSKVRMLHSIYLYLRVLTERSAITAGDSMGSKDLVITSSTQEISKWDRMIGFSSSSESGPINLDFVSSATPYKSMFEEIYSVPQSLFKLILQATHMSAMVETMQKSGRPTNIDHDTFAAEVKSLESRICAWEDGVEENSGYSAHNPLPGREIFPYHLVQAVHKALIVYFYRCVRDVNAAILQFHVQQIVYHLSEYDKKKQNNKDQSANTCWPGFIAGCEALDPQLREQIADWLDRSGRSTGIRMFTVALEAVQKVWQARSLPGMQNAPWNRILAQFSELRVLVLS